MKSVLLWILLNNHSPIRSLFNLDCIYLSIFHSITRHKHTTTMTTAYDDSSHDANDVDDAKRSHLKFIHLIIFFERIEEALLMHSQKMLV